MKNTLKQISRKSLAVIIALTLVVSCVAVSFSVFAAGSFSVPASSPAVPLFVGKTLDTSELSVEIGGATATGDTLTWTLAEGTSATYDDGVLTGASAGVTKFVVTDGDGNSQNVYVIVNAQGDNDFYLVDIDFNEDGAFKAEEWISGRAYLEEEGHFASNGYNNGQNQYGVYTTGAYKIADIGLAAADVTVDGEQKTALKIPASTVRFSTTAAFYNNPALKDFADIDFNSNISYVGTGDNYISTFSAVGFFSRVKLNPEAALEGDMILEQSAEKAYAFRLRNYGGPLYTVINGLNTSYYEAGYAGASNWETNTLAGGQATTWYTKEQYGGAEGISEAALSPGEDLISDYVLTPEAPDTADFTNRNVDFQLSGNFVKYTLDGNMIFDSSATKMSRFTLDYAMNKIPFAPAASAQSDLNPNQTYAQNINVFGGGAIAFANSNAADNNYADNYVAYDNSDLYVYSFTIAPMNILNAAALPEYGDAQQDEPQIENIIVPVNARVDLKTYKATGWTDVKTAGYEIKNGVLNVYAIAEEAFDLVNGNVTVNVTTVAADDETEFEVFAPDFAKITPDTESNEYTVDLTDGWKYPELDMLYILDGEDFLPLYDFIDEAGKVFKFTVNNPDTFCLVASTVSGEDYLMQVYALGATKRTTEGKEAIRFLTAFPQLRKTVDGIDVMNWAGGGMTYGDDEILDLSGKVGALVIPDVLLGETSIMEADMSTIADGYATVNGQKAKVVDITKLRAANANYSQAWVTLNFGDTTEAGVDKLAQDYTVAPYVEYMKQGGGLGYIFYESITRSYEDLPEAAEEPGEEPTVPEVPADKLYFTVEPVSLESRLVAPGDEIDYKVVIGNASNLGGVGPIFITDSDAFPYVANSAATVATKTDLNGSYVDWTEASKCFDADSDGFTCQVPMTLFTFKCKVPETATAGDLNVTLRIPSNNVFDYDTEVDIPFDFVDRSTVRVVVK